MGWQAAEWQGDTNVRVVFVEYRAEDPAVPINELHKMREAQIKRDAVIHGIVVFTKKP